MAIKNSVSGNFLSTFVNINPIRCEIRPDKMSGLILLILMFDTLMVFLKEYFVKVDFLKKKMSTRRRLKKQTNFPSMQRYIAGSNKISKFQGFIIF